MSTIFKRNLGSLVLTLAVTLYGLQHLGQLPSRAMIHFSFAGRPNGYASRNFLIFFLPILNLFLVFGLPLILRLSKKTLRPEETLRVLPRVNFVLTGFLVILQLGLINANISGVRQLDFCVSLAFAVMLTGLGWLLPGVGRNAFIGVRLPWTLGSDANWAATHQLMGKVMMAFGIVCFFSAFAYPSLQFPLVLLLISLLAGTAYSFWLSKTQSGS